MKEEKLSEEEIEKVYGAILGRVKKIFMKNADIEFVHLGRRNDTVACSTILGVKVTIDGKTSKLRFVSRQEDRGCRYVLPVMTKKKKFSKRSAVESILKEAVKNDVILYGETVLRRGETLERLLIEDDLLEEREENERQP